jgi:hypothetical protein
MHIIITLIGIIVIAVAISTLYATDRITMSLLGMHNETSVGIERVSRCIRRSIIGFGVDGLGVVLCSRSSHSAAFTVIVHIPWDSRLGV